FMCHSVFFHAAALSHIYTLSLHDALPISKSGFANRQENSSLLFFCHYGNRRRDSCRIHLFSRQISVRTPRAYVILSQGYLCKTLDRKSTRLNSSHVSISYAVFCLKKKRT